MNSKLKKIRDDFLDFEICYSLFNKKLLKYYYWDYIRHWVYWDICEQKKLFQVKGKEKDGLSIMLDDCEIIQDYCEVNRTTEKIIAEFLPGPITLILESKQNFAKGVTRNGNIAIRIPLNETALELAKESPIVTTSANKHESRIANNIDKAVQIFGSKCSYLDGEKPMGIESTIIDLTQDKPKIKRIGALYSSILEGIIES